MKGYVHVYTGNGKGKTTAAMGLAIRAAGADLKVFIAQFVKGMKYSELDSLAKLSSHITIKQYGRDCFIHNDPTKEDIEAAGAGFKEVKEIIAKGEHDLVILDEANIAVYYDLFSEGELIDAIKNRPEHVEIVITGRKATEKLIEIADLVTEMKEIKHYYADGVEARVGIEK